MGEELNGTHIKLNGQGHGPLPPSKARAVKGSIPTAAALPVALRSILRHVLAGN